jgi:hypothetical protein
MVPRIAISLPLPQIPPTPRRHRLKCPPPVKSSNHPDILDHQNRRCTSRRDRRRRLDDPEARLSLKHCPSPQSSSSALPWPTSRTARSRLATPAAPRSCLPSSSPPSAHAGSSRDPSRSTAPARRSVLLGHHSVLEGPRRALGDFLADDGALGFEGASVVFASALLLIAIAYYGTTVSRPLPVLGPVTLTRSLGATLTDTLTKPVTDGSLIPSRITSSMVTAACIATLPQRAGAHPDEQPAS